MVALNTCYFIKNRFCHENFDKQQEVKNLKTNAKINSKNDKINVI